ncbi:MAG: RDD family protein [Verrucomicrobiales bacterium]|nr:RDD family protein [Verrucomicrobiales bacterium]
MASWFYTDKDAIQLGPVDDSALLGLNRSGAINSRSLVWQEGMAEWASFRSVAEGLYRDSESNVPLEIGVCAHSGQIYPVSEMIPYGEALIGPEHKEAFVQTLMESGTIAVEDATAKKFDYVGFWWRVLSSVLDYMIKMVPSWICMIPYYVAAFSGGMSMSGDSPDDVFAGWSVVMMVCYGFGLLAILGVSIFYETWMVGKYQGTLGKLIIGARVVNPDGSRLTYKRAFLRWLAKKPLNYLVLFLPSTLGFAAVVGGLAALDLGGDDESSAFVLAMVTGMFVYVALLCLCAGIYWMAAFDSERRAFHDRLIGTRVVRK